jgi:uncharacterized protein (DUF2236 family)
MHAGWARSCSDQISGACPGWHSRPLTLVTAGLLPPRLREDYRFKWGRLERAAFEACRVGLRRLVTVAPEPVRWLPPARDAYRRLRTAA